VFRRRNQDDDRDKVSEADAYGDVSVPAEVERKRTVADVDRAAGPWDVDELDDPHQGRVDLGALLIAYDPTREELRVDVADGQIVAATVVSGQSAVQLQAFAAPRTEGIWAEVRQEIAGEISRQGGTVDERQGPFGIELRAQVPVQAQDGSRGVQLVRFLGVDGPRWFLRGVVSGQGAVQPQEALGIEHIFRDTVVKRGDLPMAPRDPIPLVLPPEAQPVAEQMGRPVEAGHAPAAQYSQDDLRPFERGPEITEIR
jgi:Protein of unknown function (DUF3710)